MTKPKTRDELHAFILQRAREAYEDDLENREQALDDLRFRCGGDWQWDDAVLRDRRDQGVPVITINLLGKFVRQVTNDARKNRPGIKVRGVDDESDPETASVLEGRIRHIEDQSEAVSKAYIPAIDSAATCGIGHWRVDTEYPSGNPFGRQEICIKGIANPLAVLWDPLAKDATRCDARYCFLLDDISEEEFEEKYPKATPSDFADDDLGIWRDPVTKTVRIAEYWCKEKTKKKFGRTPDGKVIDLTDIPAPSMKFMGEMEIREAEVDKIVQYIVSGGDILEGPNDFPGQYIPIIAVVGEEVYVGDQCVRSGVVRHAKGAQQLYNYWRSARAEQVAMQPKAPFIATAKQVEKYFDLWKQANKRNLPVLIYDPQPDAPPPQRSAPPMASLAITEEIVLAAQELEATTGIFAAKLGQASNETSGRAIQARQAQSDTSTLHFPDNLALSIRHTGRILVDVILATHDVEENLRLLNEDGTEKWAQVNTLVWGPDGPQFVNDLSIGKYDVTVQTGPSYATKRMESAEMILQFVQTVPNAAEFVMDLLAKNFDWPGADEIAKRFRMMLQKTHPELVEKNDEEEPPPPSPSDQMNAFAMQLELKTKELEARKTEADAEKAEMEAAKTGMEIAEMAAAGGPLALEAQRSAFTTLAKSQGGGGNGGVPQTAQTAQMPQPPIQPPIRIAPPQGPAIGGAGPAIGGPPIQPPIGPPMDMPVQAGPDLPIE